MYVGTLADINATVQPDNATNKFFTVESSNEDVVKIITLADENGYPIYKARAMKEGKSTITLTAAGNKEVKATYDINVKAGVDISGLNEALAKARTYQSSAYTEESYGQLTAAVNAATELLKGEYTKNQVLEAQMAIYEAIDGLTFRPLDETKLLDAKAEGFTVTATSECDPDKLEDGLATNVLDGKEDNYWHTEYNKDVLPQSLNFDLGGLYNLTDITFLARQGVTNGDILKAQIFVGSAKDDMKSVGTYEFDEEGNVLVNRDQYQQIAFDAKDVRYVEFKVLEAGAQDKFASMAEIRFYGERTTAALKALYDSYVAENLNKADYTADSWAVYEAKMNEAKALIEAKDTTNAAAGEALTALQTAHDRLVKLNPDPQPGDVDKSGLTTLYNQYKDTKADGYTAESWTAFNEALMKAQSVLANPNATQDEVNAAKEALQTAYDGLVKDTTPDPNPNPNPDGNGGSGGNSGSNGNSGNSGNSGSNGSNGNGGNAAVVTGDSANIAGYLMALVAAGGIAVVTFFRRKRVK